jgi:hypothetical protein
MTFVAVIPLHRSATATANGRMTIPARQSQQAGLGVQDGPDRHITRGIVIDKAGRLQLRQRRSAHRQRSHGTRAPFKSP